MNMKQIKTVLIIALVIVAGLITTCEFKKPADKANTLPQDTLFLSQWKREKAEKLKLIAHYEKHINRLQLVKDSLQGIVKEKKQTLTASQLKEKYLQDQLKQAIAKSAIGEPEKEKLLPVMDSLIELSNQSDTACNQTIKLLEQVVVNRDSVIYERLAVEQGLKDLQEIQELKDQLLTDQLNASLRVQKKKTRQSKLLAGALLILAGVASTLFITHSVR